MESQRHVRKYIVSKHLGHFGGFRHVTGPEGPRPVDISSNLHAQVLVCARSLQLSIVEAFFAYSDTFAASPLNEDPRPE